MNLSNTELTQKEADRLLRVEKYRTDDTPFPFPIKGRSLRIPLRSKSGDEEFSLDLYRGTIEIGKNMFQARARKTVILARLDLGGPPHRNPDGKEILCPHIHLYQEGYDDKWAYPLPPDFHNPKDISRTLDEFMEYCHIVEKPNILRGSIL
jgi:hypothetical protein